MSDTFNQPSADSPFNINDWVAGVRLPEKSVVVYQRPDLVGEYEALSVALKDAQVAAAVEAADDRLGGSAGDRVAEIAERMEAARQAMSASAVTFRFRSPSPDEVELVKKEAGKHADSLEVTFRLLARQCVEPKGLTWETFKAMYAGFGDGYFANTILRCANEAREAGAVDVPFSRSALAARKTQGS